MTQKIIEIQNGVTRHPDFRMAEPVNLLINKGEQILANASTEALIDAVLAIEDSRYFEHFGFDIPEIPYLAKGGIVDEPTVATIGEDGKEAVVPLENNLEWITNLAQKLISEFKSIIVPNNEVDKGINNIVTDDYIKPYQVSFDNQFNTLNDSIDRLIGLINEHLPNIANNMDREIVLDSGALAVGMSRKIDLQLGKISKSKGRGNV